MEVEEQAPASSAARGCAGVDCIGPFLRAVVAGAQARRRIFDCMNLVHTNDDRELHPFQQRAASTRSQGGTMALAPGESTKPGNRHPGDQWVYVVSGCGVVAADGGGTPISAGDLILIEAGEPHQIRNTGSEPLRCINVYAPPSINP